jgi:hypothetical protein
MRSTQLHQVFRELTAYEYLREAMVRFVYTLHEDVVGGVGDERLEGSQRALWHYAHVVLRAYDAREENVMLWAIMAWASSETMYDLAGVRALPPFTLRELSFIRSLLRQSPAQELDAFLAAVEQARPELLERWQEWTSACECAPPAISDDCAVHAVMDQLHRSYVGLGEQEAAIFFRVKAAGGVSDQPLTASNVQDRSEVQAPVI